MASTTSANPSGTASSPTRRSVLRTVLGLAARRHFVAFHVADDAGIARTTSPPRTTNRISLSADQAVALYEACEGWHW